MLNQIQANTSDSIHPATAKFEPYPPSFVDRFMRFIERLPIPYWLTYLALFVLQSTAFHVLGWIDGWLPAYAFSPILLLFPLWLWGPLAIITYLNSISRQAVSDFGPLLNLEPATMRQLEYEFTTMPAKGVIFSSVFWSVVYFIFSYLAFDSFYVGYEIGPVLTVITIVQGWISYLTGSVIYYHSIRQLRLVHRTVKLVKQFDLFQLDPVYAFSVLTSRTGMAWVLLLTFTVLVFPIQIAAAPILTLMVVQLVLAVAAFALPLHIVHQRLVAEKRRLEGEHDERVKSALAELHRRLANNELGDMVQLNSALSGLNAERDILAKIPTWPWRVGLLTGFLSIVVLPIILFLIQLVIGRWMGS